MAQTLKDNIEIRVTCSQGNSGSAEHTILHVYIVDTLAVGGKLMRGLEP
ncbi:MAG: hypothetical protein DDT34_01830 [Firmicutes bacterium]|nr:hypothetical protein [Bacillota bacterium]